MANSKIQNIGDWQQRLKTQIAARQKPSPVPGVDRETYNAIVYQAYELKRRPQQICARLGIDRVTPTLIHNVMVDAYWRDGRNYPGPRNARRAA